MQKPGDSSGILLTGGCASAANARESDRVFIYALPRWETLLDDLEADLLNQQEVDSTLLREGD